MKIKRASMHQCKHVEDKGGGMPRQSSKRSVNMEIEEETAEAEAEKRILLQLRATGKGLETKGTDQILGWLKEPKGKKQEESDEAT